LWAIVVYPPRVTLNSTGYTLKFDASPTTVLSNFIGNYIEDRAYMGVNGYIENVLYNKDYQYVGTSASTTEFYSKGVDLNFSHNTLICRNTGNYYRSGINVIGAKTILISYNYFDVDCAGIQHTSIDVYGSDGGIDTTSCWVHHNYLLTNANSHHISVGAEETTTGDNKIKNIIIEKNSVVDRSRYTLGGYTTIAHNIYIGFQKDGIMRYNYVNGGGICLIYKGSSGTESTEAAIYGNIAINGFNNDLYVKGVRGMKVYNNTFYNNWNTLSLANGHMFYTGGNYGGDEPDNCIFKNNIVIDESVLDYTELIYVGTPATLGFVSDNNILFTQNGKVGYFGGLVAECDFTTWQAAGFDANSLNQNTPFFDLATWKMWLATPVKSGADLDAMFETLLDISTDWGSSTSFPNIVTKEQGASKNIGAYVN